MNSTVTAVTGVTQPSEIALLDVLSRYPSQLQILLRFSPSSITLDRYITPLWVPFALCGCPIVAVVYAFSEWLSYSRPIICHSLMEQRFQSLSIYLTCVALSLLLRDFFLILLDLDVAWDTGILASNTLTCPLVHAFCTTFKHAVTVYTLCLAMEALAFSNENSLVFARRPFKWLRAGRNIRKALRIALVALLICLCLGLIETTYWRVKYHTPRFENELSARIPTSSTRLSRCEVVGGFQRFFAGEYLQVASDYTNEAQARIDGLAASYADYRWVKAIAIECFTALLSLSLALMIVRNCLLHPMEMNTIAMVRGKADVMHIITWCLVHGLSGLPESLLTMLEPLSRPGETRLTDGEVDVDRTWQRYLTMITAQVVSFELADSKSALLLPICLSLSKEFRRRFLQIFGCASISDRRGFRSIISCKRNIPATKSALTPSLHKPPSIQLNRVDRSPSSSTRYVDADALKYMHDCPERPFENEQGESIYDQEWLLAEDRQQGTERSVMPEAHGCVQCHQQGSGISLSNIPAASARASTGEFDGNQLITVVHGFPHTCRADWYEPRSFV